MHDALSIVRFFLLLALLWGGGTVRAGEPVVAGEEVAAAENSGNDDSLSDQPPLLSSSDNWIDSGHHYTSASVDALAAWLDHFFGVPRADLESAYSVLRINYESGWEEYEGNSDKLKIRGKVHLPQINKRLSLVFTDDDGEESELDDDDGSATDENSSTKVGLQYTARESQRSRLDFGLGLRSSFQGKASARYRYQQPWGKYINRLTQTLYFYDGDGFGTRSRYELDRRVDSRRLLRWVSSGKFAEDIVGVEWSTRFTRRPNVINHSTTCI
ncbi:MAG TPA: hypothetical protein ENI05_14655 [Porticoccus sp.]|nr:hypothetical protein [Porticoccus sp.]